MNTCLDRVLASILVFLLTAGIIFPAHASLKSVDEMLARGDQKQALEELTRLVNQDDADAQERLADWYISGQGVPLNYSMAWQWYKRAALQGHAPAQYKVGFLYQNGIGVGRYIDKAAEWYEFAAKQNHFAAQIRLANVWATMGQMRGGKTLHSLTTAASRGDRLALQNLQKLADAGYKLARDMLDRLPREIRVGASVKAPTFNSVADKGLAAFAAGDYITAISIFKSLADAQKPGGTFGLGLVHQIGPEILSDADKAEAYYKKAANEGSAEAMTNLGLYYWQSMAPPNDKFMAQKWLSQAIEKGSERAKRALSLINGGDLDQQTARELRLSLIAEPTSSVGLLAFNNKDFVSAITIFKQLADEGKADGLLGLGLVFDRGIPPLLDRAQALQLYRTAANTGYAGAQVNLANLYLNGIGVKKNTDEAMKWYRQAANQNDPLAQNMLAYAFLTGAGKKQNLGRAVELFAKAERQGNDDAMNAEALLNMGARNSAKSNNGRAHFEISIRTAYASGATKISTVVQLPGSVIPEDHPKKLEMLRTAANLGNVSAQYNLARVRLLGEQQPAHLKEAYTWFTRAHHNGHPTALTEREHIRESLTLPQQIEAEWMVAGSLTPRTIVPPADAINAIAGAPDEQWEIGVKYRYGRGVEKDYKEAIKWFGSAASKGHAIAQRDLATMYRRGLGVKKNNEEAAKWLRLSANQGYMKAQRDLGIAHQFGRGVPKDEIEAVRWYRKAADQGEKKAQSNLAFMYKTGLGVPQNFEEAVNWYRKAADQGSSTAQKNLGVLYQFGKGVEQDHVEAVKWYQMSADQGNLKAEENLGFMYTNGLGVKMNYEKAARWYYKAATRGSARAQNVLGVMYQSGSGIRQNFGRAIKWYLKALNQRYKKTYGSIDSLIKEGPENVPEYKELVIILKKLAEQGNARAQNSMGLIYRFGRSVDKDRVLAEQWFKKAIKKGHAEAKVNLTEMRLDQSQ